MGHLPIRGAKGFLTILALMALSSFRIPGFLRSREAKALPGTLPSAQPQVFDVAA